MQTPTFTPYPECSSLQHLIVHELDIDDITKSFKAYIKEGKVPVDIAVSFLYAYAKKYIHTKFDSVWKSYGVTIANKGDTVTPLSVLEIEISTTDGSNKLECSIKPEDPHWLAMFALSVYRIGRVQNDDYKEKLKLKIVGQMKHLGFTSTNYPADIVFDTWQLNNDCNKLIAAFDMYFCKFPKHEKSYLRVCTINSRMKDCAALMSLGYITRLLNMQDDSDILDWVFTTQMAEELCNMIQDKEEYNVVDSYFPYQSDLMLVSKTYYSNSKNPQTHLFKHSIGTLSKSGRSRNARHVSDMNSLNIVQNAKIVAYAFATRFELNKPFQKQGAPTIPDGEREDSVIGEPQSTRAHEWFTFYQNRGFKLSKEIDAFVEREKRRLATMTLRDESIGKYVADNF